MCFPVALQLGQGESPNLENSGKNSGVLTVYKGKIGNSSKM